MSDLIAIRPLVIPRPRHGMMRAACVATLAAAGLLAGCERSNPSNDAALARIAEATAYRKAGGDPEVSVTAAEAAIDADASDAVQSVASELNADISVQRAQALIGRRATDEQDAGLVITQTDALNQAFSLTQLANTVALTQTFIESEQQTNPQPTLQLITGMIEGIQSGESWSPAESVEGQLASIAATDEQIVQLQSQVQSLQERGNQLAQQRSQLLSEASELDAEIGLQEPAQAEQTDQQILDLRNQAADLTAQAQLNDAEVLRLEMQIAEFEAFKAALEGAVASLQGQAQTLEESWAQVSEQINALEARKQQIYTGEAPSVLAMGEALASTLGRLATVEEEVLSLLDRAVSSYGDARSKASAAISGKREDWSAAFQEAFDQNRNSLQLAITRRRQASVHIGSAAVHHAVLTAQRTLEGGGQSLPSALGGDAEQAFADAVQQAAEALSEALSDAQNAAGAQGPISRAATLQEALVLTDMLTLRELVAASGVDVTLEIPDEGALQNQLGQVVNTARQDGVQLPPLPALVAAGATAPSEPADGELGGLGGETPPPGEGEAGEDPDAPEADPDAPADDPDAPAGEPDDPAGDPALEPGSDPGLNPGADPGLDPANNDDPALDPGDPA